MNRAYELAKAEIGTWEWAEGHNPKVLAYFRDAGSPDIRNDEVAWCAAFVGAMLKRAGLKPTGSLLARSYLTFGEPVTLEQAREGDIVVLKRGKSSWQGHVGFYVKHTSTTVTLLGGNQANQVNRRAYPLSQVLGVRRIDAAAGRRVLPRAEPTAPSRGKSGAFYVGVAAIVSAVAVWWDQIMGWFG